MSSKISRSVRYTLRNPSFSTPQFFETPDNSSQKLFPSLQSNTVNFNADFSNNPIFQTNFRFPWRLKEKNQISTVTLDKSALCRPLQN